MFIGYNMTKKLIKSASFTDIHFGAKANSIVHNDDCIRYLEWFCDNVTSDPDIDHINFLGDWNENRSALNIHTLNKAYAGAQMLNKLGLPVYFIIGNHDLYYRNSRTVHSVIHHNEFSNFRVIDEPVIIDNIGTTTGALMCPYLFHDEYPSLTKYLNIDTWWGHFEFKGFVVTGYTITMPTGPDSEHFAGPNHIFSGHFHKRQAHKGSNVVYIGNTFPTNFGDAGQTDRGMMTYNHESDETLFYDWEELPRYTKTRLTDILDKENRNKILFANARVNCLVDVPISFEESNYLKQKFKEEYNLREFVLEESPDIKVALSETETEIDWNNMELQGVDDLVLLMLEGIESDHIENSLLIQQYQEIEVVND